MKTLKTINELSADVQAAFQINYEQVEKNQLWFPQLSQKAETTQRVLTQEWIHDHAKITETQFGQPPTYHQLSGEYTTIPLKIYDDALEISAYDYSADKIGNIAQRASDMGKRAAKHPQDLAAYALANGDTAAFLMYDGQNFFSNTHPKPNGGNIDNLMAGAFDDTNFNAVRTAMQRFCSDLGTAYPYGIKPNFVIAPPDLEVTIAKLLNNTWLPSSNAAVDNVFKGMATSIIESRLTDANDWYVASTELGVMPFIEIRHSEFGSFDLHEEVGTDTVAFRDHSAYRWWIRAVMTVYFTRPETMIKVVN